MAKLPSPCIDICKFRLKADGDAHCLGCGMTKPQKKTFKRLDGGKKRQKFIAALMAQQARLGRPFKAWRTLYGRKLARKGVAWPA